MRTKISAALLGICIIVGCDRTESVHPGPGGRGPRGNVAPNAGGPAARQAGPRAGAPNAITQPGAKGQNVQVTVTQILVSFAGAPGSKATRTKEEAEKLANELFTKAQSNAEPFAALRKQTDDPASAIYNVCIGKDKKSPNDKLRSEVPVAVGDAVFTMKQNEVKLIPYDEKKAPGGFYILKRLDS